MNSPPIENDDDIVVGGDHYELTAVSVASKNDGATGVVECIC